MSGIPLSYFTGLGAVPAGRADPAACERLVDAKARYDSLKAARACSAAAKAARPGDCGQLTNAYSEWQALKAASACRAAPASQPTQPTSPAPRTLVNLPTYQARPRDPRQSSLPPLATLFAPPQPQQSTMATIPAWAKVLGGVSVAVIVVTMISKALRRRG